MDTTVFIAAVITLITFHSNPLQLVPSFAAGNPVDDVTKPPAKSCMGANTKPTKDRLLADKECSAEFPNKRCGRICRLEKLGVIQNDAINDFMWPSFVEASFPTIAHPQLIPLFKACTPRFVHGANLTEDCTENSGFTNCMRDAVFQVCTQPLPL